MKLKSIVLASVLSLSVGSVFADVHGLKLCSKNISEDVTVSCNGKQGPYPIHPNSCLDTMPWFVIKGLFGSNASCDFKTAGGPLETGAKVTISPNFSQGQVAKGVAAPGYQVDVSPQGQFADVVTGTISKE